MAPQEGAMEVVRRKFKLSSGCSRLYFAAAGLA